MSTRVHKVMGYGARLPGYHAMADRLDQNQVDGEVSAALWAAIERVKARPPTRARDLELCDLEFATATVHYMPSFYCPRSEDYPRFFLDLIHYADHPDSKRGLTVIVPPAMASKWFRFDDDMDYQEASRSLATKVRRLDRPLYPYMMLMDPVTGEELQMRYGLRECKEDNPTAVPTVPPSVRVIANAAGIPWLDLRPVVATWWC